MVCVCVFNQNYLISDISVRTEWNGKFNRLSTVPFCFPSAVFQLLRDSLMGNLEEFLWGSFAQLNTGYFSLCVCSGSPRVLLCLSWTISRNISLLGKKGKQTSSNAWQDQCSQLQAGFLTGKLSPTKLNWVAFLQVCVLMYGRHSPPRHCSYLQNWSFPGDEKLEAWCTLQCFAFALPPTELLIGISHCQAGLLFLP